MQTALIYNAICTLIDTSDISVNLNAAPNSGSPTDSQITEIGPDTNKNSQKPGVEELLTGIQVCLKDTSDMVIFLKQFYRSSLLQHRARQHRGHS